MTQPTPTTAPLLGRWHTQGEIFGDDGLMVVGRVDGSDEYIALGPTTLHLVDVEIAGRRTRAFEVLEPYDPERAAFPTRAYDEDGGERPWMQLVFTRDQ